MLSQRDRGTLLTIAREAIHATLNRQPFDPDQYSPSEAIRRHAGAFVTLERSGQLRGCIGAIHSTDPLHRTVARNAVSAAFRDPRFPPLTRAELDGLEVEISVMGPVEPVTDFDSIKVGRDGLIVRDGHRTGLLLPQVAIDLGWDRDTFLSQTCRKAGLSPDCWRSSSCSVEKFSAEVFS
ncbi:MAG TPA: AmmeMemoRadiSam system protein A [Thermoanaerobaculia bacterium]|nr:AmmeMemoRadiSam system protein A [Thermoanaerobaculia bacterium]